VAPPATPEPTIYFGGVASSEESIDQVNFASISPVLVFDTAGIGPQAASTGGGIRYGVGGGIRFSLLDTVRFTAGYAFNPNPKSWEGRGATFFRMEIVFLFR
jgi:hypothetical protein